MLSDYGDVRGLVDGEVHDGKIIESVNLIIAKITNVKQVIISILRDQYVRLLIAVTVS